MKSLVLLLGVLSLASTQTAGALIINVDAITNTTTNRVSILLEPGAYTVTPIGVADGGSFNAWDANIFDTSAGVSWLHAYTIASAEISPFGVGFWDGNYYGSELDALAHAIGTTFTLSSAGIVDFYIADNPHSDNSGGVSLRLIPEVPEPSTALLLGIGLALLSVVGSTRSRRR